MHTFACPQPARFTFPFLPELRKYGVGFAMSAMAGGLIAGAGDLTAQSSEHFLKQADGAVSSKLMSWDEVDKKRLLGAVTFGIACKGLFQHYYYGFCLPRIFQNAPVKMLAFDSLVWVPLGYYPLYYTINGYVQRNDSPKESVAKYCKDFTSLIPVYCSFWIPVQALNMTFVPRLYRNPVILGVSVLWMAILSNQQKKLEEKKEE